MSPSKAPRTRRITPPARPEYRLGRDLLDPLLAGLPPPWPGAPVAWRHARLRRIINEIAAFAPFDWVEAMFASHVVLFRHLAADLERRSLAHEVPDRLAHRLRSSAADLLRTAAQAERRLNRRPPRPVPANVTPPTDGFDLAALDAVWCASRVARPTPGPLPDAADPAPDAWGMSPTRTLPAWARQPGGRC